MVAGPIPWRDVVAYAKHHELDPENERLFVSVIRDLDDAYIQDQLKHARLAHDRATRKAPKKAAK